MADTKCCILWKVVWQLFVTTACSGLAFAGVVLIKQNVADAKNDTDAAIKALGVLQDNLKYYNDIPKYSDTAVGIVAAAASTALLLGIIRMLLVCCSTGAYPRRTTILHLIFNILSMVFSWVASALMVFAMCAATLYFATCLIADKGSSQLLTSDLDTKWSNIRIVYQKVVVLINQYLPLAKDLADVAPEVERVLTPAIDAATLALPQPSDACAKTCLDLATISIFDTRNSTMRCLCDLTRLQATQPHFESAWQQHLSLVLLGIVLAWLGMSWIALDQTAQITRAMGELHHDKTMIAAPPVTSDNSAQDVYKQYIMSNGGYPSSPGVPMSVQQDTAPAADQYHPAEQQRRSGYNRYAGV